MQHLHPYGAGPKRFVAITPRHVIGCAHYGWNANPPPVRFRDINNNLIVRNCIRSYNLMNGPDPKPIINDIEIWLLDEDLPPSITPAPIVGDWFFNHTGSNTSYNILPAAFGFYSFNQDSHIAPAELIPNKPGAVHTSNFQPFILSDEEFSGFELLITWYGILPDGTGVGIYNSPLTLEGFQDWSWFTPLSGIFYHALRSGDSGSPIFFPVENGWALGPQMVSGSMWRPAGLNALIRAVDSLHGINTGYTVTVAPNPIIA
jgi:hypothetical protein